MRLRSILAATIAIPVVALVIFEPRSASAQRAGPFGGPRPAADTTAIVFDDVTVIDIERGTRLPAQRVTVVGSRIRALGPAGARPLPPGAHVVDARDKYLIPGLWDMYLHLWRAPETVGYPLLIANGVTGVRDPGSPVPLATLRRWKQEIAAGRRIGPRLVVAGPAVYRCPLPPLAVAYRYGICVVSPEAGRLAIDSLKAAGADFAETYIEWKYVWEPETLYYAMAARARQVGLPFGGHPPGVASGVMASDSGARFLNNGTYLWMANRPPPDFCEAWYAAAVGIGECAALADTLRRNDTWMVLTPPLPRLRYQLAQYRRFLPERKAVGRRGAGDHFDIPTWFTVAGSIPLDARPSTTAGWRMAFSYVDSVTETPMFPSGADGRVKEAAGLPIVVGSDAVFASSALAGLPGFALHDALAMLVVRGMTPLAALRTATLNPAKALHLTDSLGTVAVGKIADLVLLDADPLADINNITAIRAVMANGRYYDRAALDRLLVDAERAAHR